MVQEVWNENQSYTSINAAIMTFNNTPVVNMQVLQELNIFNEIFITNTSNIGTLC